MDTHNKIEQSLMNEKFEENKVEWHTWAIFEMNWSSDLDLLWFSLVHARFFFASDRGEVSDKFCVGRLKFMYVRVS